MKTICAVYRSRRNPDTYLYVDHHEGLSRVPEALARERGGTERAMTLVLRAIREQGYYLQMPPMPEALRVQGRDPTS